jgi:O-antigen/teichoic acid export membrane protein
MTTKVMKGSMWTLAGSVLPLAVSFISTPFIIRFLGSEAYGVLLLVGLIPTYLSFADFGMGVASTRFASEAFGDGDPNRERAYVKNATVICLGFSTVIFLPILIFAQEIVPIFSVPLELQNEAAVALRISTVAFVLSLLSTVVNAPQLARLRMDLNSLANGTPKIFMALATPLILYLGGGIAEAVWLGLAAAIAALLLNFYFSSLLLPVKWELGIDTELVRPLLRFGGGWFIGSIAAALLGNMEKLILARFVSVEALAHYSVAFTLAGMVSLFSIAFKQSLLPAFAQLSRPDQQVEFELLVRRGVRLVLAALVPGLVLLCVIARPFFTLWAGEDFGRESTLPFYILAIGLFFSMLSYLPHSAITARGRTDIFARLYWVELFSYAVVATILVFMFGILGAAVAWTLRVIADSLIIIFLAKRVTHISFGFAANGKALGWSILIMLPLAAAAAYDNFSLFLIALAPICLGIYGTFVWNAIIDDTEKSWIRSKFSLLFG